MLLLTGDTVLEKISPIRNPLTIIAMFAAIAEISGTVVLPFIAPANQAIYVWFLIVFPILLIVLFFLTLNFNHKVLYAPSDYQNEDNFLRSLPRATFAEKALQIEAEISEEPAESAVPSESENLPTSTVAQSPDIQTTQLSNQNVVRSITRASYMLAEDLIFRKLGTEFSSEIQREVKLGTQIDDYICDGIVRDKGVTTIIEVKLLRHPVTSSMQLRDTLRRIKHAVGSMPAVQIANLRVLLALASVDRNASPVRMATQIDRYRNEFPFPIEVRFYDLAALQQEVNVGVE